MSPGIASRRISKTEMMKEPYKKPKALIGYRHIQIFMLTWVFLSCYATRITLSVALVAMTDSQKANPEFKDFDWDESTQNIVLSSFYWGYVVTQLPASVAAQRWGGQRILAGAVTLCALVTLVTPTAANIGGWTSVCICRALVGMFQGMVPPVLHTLLAKWAPVQERARMTSFVYTGGCIGNVISLQSSGTLSMSSAGWPSCFYVWGGITAMFAAIWFIFGKESPADTPGIPFDEKEYIETSLGVTETNLRITTPWSSILTSKPVWALCISQCCNMWGTVMMMTKIPSYLSSVLGFNIENNGLLSSTPYLVAWLFSFPVSFAADYLVRADYLTLKSSRIGCNTLGEVTPAILLIALSYVSNEQRMLAVGVLILAVSTNVGIFSGHHVNHMDLSPNFAGIIMAFTNTMATFCSIIAPLVVGVIITDAKDSTQWKDVFFLTSGIYMLGAISFFAFGAVNVQTWNDPESRRESKYDDTFDIISISAYLQRQEKDNR